jgi:hypothetical protein
MPGIGYFLVIGGGILCFIGVVMVLIVKASIQTELPPDFQGKPCSSTEGNEGTKTESKNTH